MNFKYILNICFVSLFFFSCGKGTLDLSDADYEPKIVIQGTLIPGQFAQVKLRRNFPLNSAVNLDELILPAATARIIDEDGNTYNLQYNSSSQFYESSQLVAEYGKTYTLEVEAEIEEKPLSATSTTTVPLPGFEIKEEKSTLDTLIYRPRNPLGALINFRVVFERSPGTDFYPASITALDADKTTFIYDNPFGEIDSVDVEDDLELFKYTYTWIQDAPSTPGESYVDIFSFFTWFYGSYQVVVYAGDKNFRDFVLSYNQIQEIDGNFHEPAFHIDGDGIGLFGSAIPDTAYFTVIADPEE